MFVAIWQDRHTDTEVYCFSEAEKAIEWAKKWVRESDRHGELDETMSSAMINGGWLYYGRYSCEGDNIRVVECTVDAELNSIGD